MNWQPIETAPKDIETYVLGWDSEEECVEIMVWEPHGRFGPGWEQIPGRWPVFPTHWMPLPAPPETQGDDQ